MSYTRISIHVPWAPARLTRWLFRETKPADRYSSAFPSILSDRVPWVNASAPLIGDTPSGHLSSSPAGDGAAGLAAAATITAGSNLDCWMHTHASTAARTASAHAAIALSPGPGLLVLECCMPVGSTAIQEPRTIHAIRRANAACLGKRAALFGQGAPARGRPFTGGSRAISAPGLLGRPPSPRAASIGCCKPPGRRLAEVRKSLICQWIVTGRPRGACIEGAPNPAERTRFEGSGGNRRVLPHFNARNKPRTHPQHDPVTPPPSRFPEQRRPARLPAPVPRRSGAPRAPARPRRSRPCGPALRPGPGRALLLAPLEPRRAEAGQGHARGLVGQAGQEQRLDPGEAGRDRDDPQLRGRRMRPPLLGHHL